uniref:Cation transporter n=1 Tax=Strongyloides venezuelensis TaxID=75913 RepID=A0A0K0G081_STRVS
MRDKNPMTFFKTSDTKQSDRKISHTKESKSSRTFVKSTLFSDENEKQRVLLGEINSILEKDLGLSSYVLHVIEVEKDENLDMSKEIDVVTM